MKKSFIVPLLTLCALALFVPANSPAATPTPKPTPKIHTTIQSVDASSITTKGKTSVTYKITPDTEITFKGETAKVTDLKPGMRVSVSAGSDPTVAERIAADDPPKDEKK